MFNRRNLLKLLASLGIGTPIFHRAVASMAQDGAEVTPEMIQQAEWIAGLELSEEEREATASSVNRLQRSVGNVRQAGIDYDELPAVYFRPLGATTDPTTRYDRAPAIVDQTEPSPTNDEELAFLPVSQLAKLIQTRTVSSTDLTRVYLDRLKRFNPVLNCVVTLTEERALEQAKQADEEIRRGDYRGPLHGIPWGAKDLVAYPGYPTTWGAPQFENQHLDHKATIAQRLDEAGAVLVAKLSMGALAMGDQWFRGRTNSPWNPNVGSSGSSAGSASAVVAGLCGFTIGTETLGSIVSPSRRCGSTGLRPTFGRVSRHGCMALSWTMDKIGPITRSVEDCALIFSAIVGTDGEDPTVVDQPFEWKASVDFGSLRVGYTERVAQRGENSDDQEETPRPDLDALRELGVQLVPIELPGNEFARDLTTVLNAEAATVFDQLTRTGNTEGINAWSGIFRTAEFMTAVDYLQAMRLRRRLMHLMEEAIADVDVLVNVNDLVITNLTGHPSVVMPWSYRERGGMPAPVSLLVTGHLYDESRLMAVAHALQQKTDAHLQAPPMEDHLAATQAEANEEDD